MKEVVSQNADYTAMDIPRDVRALMIGYVGHWGSSEELIGYLKRSIVPMLDRGYSISIDNTACRSMSDPERVSAFLGGLKFGNGVSLDIKGNQAISVGKWDVLLGKSKNFSATVSSDKVGVTYPNCREHQGYVCLPQVQLNETALCTDRETKLKRLRCCRTSVDHHTIQDSAEGIAGGGAGARYVWETAEACAQ